MSWFLSSTFLLCSQSKVKGFSCVSLVRISIPFMKAPSPFSNGLCKVPDAFES